MLDQATLAPPSPIEAITIDDRFTQESVKPIPIFAPTPQGAMEHYADKSEKPDIPFRKDVRQLLVSMLFQISKIPVRELQVLEHHGEVAVIFFLPHGFVSYREANQGPDIFEEIALLRQEIADLKAIQQQTLAEIQKAAAVQRQILAEMRPKEREAQRQQAIERRRQIDLDPIIPLSTIPLGKLYTLSMRQLILELIYWQEDYSLQEHQAWGERVASILQSVQKGLTLSKTQLTPGEYEFMRHYLDLCVANPAIWHPAGG